MPNGNASRVNKYFSFLTFDIRVLWGIPECQKIKNGVLDQYGAECFGRLIFATNVEMKGLVCGF